MTVIKELHQRNTGFGVAHGWQLKLWERELTLNNKKGEPYTALHKVWYIIQDETGHVITSQYKAWMDSVRMAMMIDLIWNIVCARDNGMLVWMDNCGSHKTTAIEGLLKELKINVALFPKNMTAILQMLDLIVNGPIKRNLRSKRAMKIYEAFREFKAEYEVEVGKSDAEAARSGRKEISFKHPKPNMEECIKDLMDLLVEGSGQFTTDEFKGNIMDTMVKTGCCPIFTFPVPETQEELLARKFVTYESAMALSNNSSYAMQCIPTGSAPQLIAIEGSEEKERKAQVLHEEMVALFEAHLLEADSDESDSDDAESSDESYFGEEEDTNQSDHDSEDGSYDEI